MRPFPHKTSWTPKFLENRMMVAIGYLSYSWYLWHWPILSIFRANSLEKLSILQNLLLCFMAFGLAGITYLFLEEPIRRKRLSFVATSKRTFAMGGGVFSFMLCSSMVMGLWAKYFWKLDDANHTQLIALQRLESVHTDCWQPRPYKGDLLDKRLCFYPENEVDQHPDVIIWGDSHAEHLIPFVRAFVERRNLSVQLRYMAECPPLMGFQPDKIGIHDAVGCDRFNSDVLDEIRWLKNSGLGGVIIAARWTGYMRNSDAVQLMSSGFEKTLNELQLLGLKVLIIAPVPDMPFRVPKCLLRRSVEECGVNRYSADAHRESVMEFITKEVSKRDDFRILDPFDSFCSENYCWPQIGDVVLFSDSHHLSVGGAEKLLETESDMLEWLTSMGVAIQAEH